VGGGGGGGGAGEGDILSSEAACLTCPSLQVHCPKTMVSYGMCVPEIQATRCAHASQILII